VRQLTKLALALGLEDPAANSVVITRESGDPVTGGLPVLSLLPA
jgi:hypothetical protein